MSLTIASSLVALQNERLRAHASRPRVIEIAQSPWLVPPGAEALFTYQTQWKTAPGEPPPGWPGSLKWLQIASAGVDTFPSWALAVPLVTRGRGVQAPAIAEYVIGAVYAHEKMFWEIRARSRQQWQARMLGAVAGKRLGIAGYGAIGAEVASLALRIGLKVSVFTRSGAGLPPEVEHIASMPELAARSDHLVLAVPLTPATRNLVDTACLAAAKPGLHLINVARGAVIDDDALLAALDSGRLSAATLDVTNPEPLPEGHPFYSHPAIRLTPHVCGGAEDGEERLAQALLANLDAYVAGQPLSGVVNPALGY